VNTRDWSIGVVVPARDEATLIDGCLRALRLAVAEVSRDVAAVDVVVVADSCRDATAAVAARSLDGWGRVLEVDSGTAGGARQAGVASVLALARAPLHRLWLANTDGDTRVTAGWLRQQLNLAASGAIAVAGMVEVDSFSEHPPELEARWRRRYLPARGGTHSHVHGANLGVRADAYLGVGGFDRGAAGEDQRLWFALRDAGHPTSSPTSLLVTTSGRARGRAAGGFADTLRRLAEEDRVA
jgi:cellulose synthase/poly-beta-1,6-N-acetylglucosamine synthase-like glycosyltransferase